MQNEMKIVIRHAYGQKSSITYKSYGQKDVYQSVGPGFIWLYDKEIEMGPEDIAAIIKEKQMERSDIKECEAREDKAARDTAERKREVASLVEDAKKEISHDSDKWVYDNLVDDPMEIVARVLFIATFKSNDTAFIGQWIIDMSKQIIERSVKVGLDS